jgi:hypothetical protein
MRHYYRPAQKPQGRRQGQHEQGESEPKSAGRLKKGQAPRERAGEHTGAEPPEEADLL